jgi:hypothetical protein
MMNKIMLIKLSYGVFMLPYLTLIGLRLINRLPNEFQLFTRLLPLDTLLIVYTFLAGLVNGYLVMQTPEILVDFFLISTPEKLCADQNFELSRRLFNECMQEYSAVQMSREDFKNLIAHCMVQSSLYVMTNTLHKAAKTDVDQEFLDKLLEEKKNFIQARTSTLPQGKVEEILETLKKTFGLADTDQAIAVIASLFQQGGTARSCDGNLPTNLFGQNIKLADLRRVLKNLSCNRSERKLARSLATPIQKVSATLEIPGNLHSKITRIHSEVSFEKGDIYWMSDFQSDNPDCPSHIRKLITETFQKKGVKRTSKKKKN